MVLRKLTILLTAITMVLTLSSCETVADWRKTKTKTEDGDADMGLGEYKGGLKHAIGVKDFDNEAGWQGNVNMGQNLSIMLESALFDTGRFVLVEREKLTDVIQEQDLVASGRTAQAKDIAKTGLLRPAKYLASGALTEVEEGQAGADGGVRIGGFRVGLGRNDAQVTIIAKLIDTTTGEIVSKKRIVGRPSGIKARIGYSGSKFGADLGGFRKTPLGQAAQEAINEAAKFFAQSMEEFPFQGNVVKTTSSGSIIINRGSEYGVEEGQVLTLATEGELLVDPSTGAVLGKEEGGVIGTIKVTKVAEKVAYCQPVSGEANPEPGTVVEAEE